MDTDTAMHHRSAAAKHRPYQKMLGLKEAARILRNADLPTADIQRETIEGLIRWIDEQAVRLARDHGL